MEYPLAYESAFESVFQSVYVSAYELGLLLVYPSGFLLGWSLELPLVYSLR